MKCSRARRGSLALRGARARAAPRATAVAIAVYALCAAYLLRRLRRYACRATARRVPRLRMCLPLPTCLRAVYAFALPPLPSAPCRAVWFFAVRRRRTPCCCSVRAAFARTPMLAPQHQHQQSRWLPAWQVPRPPAKHPLSVSESGIPAPQVCFSFSIQQGSHVRFSIHQVLPASASEVCTSSLSLPCLVGQLATHCGRGSWQPHVLQALGVLFFSLEKGKGNPPCLQSGSHFAHCTAHTACTALCVCSFFCTLTRLLYSTCLPYVSLLHYIWSERRMVLAPSFLTWNG